MQETGNLEIRKLTSNALFNTGKQTLNAYVEQGKEAINGVVNDAMHETNFAIVKAGTTKIPEYSPMSGDWKVPLRNYISK
jgi:hypothetical protein